VKTFPGDDLSHSTPAALDHVDDVRAQWQAVCPELDTSPMGVVARVGRLAAYFDDSINDLMRGYGLARSSWDVLASLRRVGEPYELSPTELYHGLMRTSGAMTNRLRRLEDSGLVERVPDPRDGRGLRVRLTSEGLGLVDRIAQAHMDNEARLLAELEPSEFTQLELLLRRLLVSFEDRDPGAPFEASPSAG
jgi:DNA-binding MarR family transcriptional regulator